MCKNGECRFKVPADEIERVLLERIRELSTRDDMMADIIKAANERLQKELPQLKQRKALLQNDLAEVRELADGVMDKCASMAGGESSLFLREKLDQLGKRRKEIETGICTLEEVIAEIERKCVSRELVMLALNRFTDVFQLIQPYQQRELLRLVLHKAVLARDSMEIALYGRPPDIGQFPRGSEWFAQTPIWLLE